MRLLREKPLPGSWVEGCCATRLEFARAKQKTFDKGRLKPV